MTKTTKLLKGVMKKTDKLKKHLRSRKPKISQFDLYILDEIERTYKLINSLWQKEGNNRAIK